MINVNVEGVQRTLTNLRARSERLAHPQPALEMGGQIVRAAAVRRIKQQGGDQVWIPNKRGGHTGIDSGRMWQSIQVDPPTDTSVKVGTNVRYALWFQNGTGIFAGHSEWTIKPSGGKALAFTIGGVRYVRKSVVMKGQPGRPFLVITTTESKKIVRALSRYVLHGLA